MTAFCGGYLNLGCLVPVLLIVLVVIWFVPPHR